VDLVDNNTQAFWLDAMTLIQSGFGKLFFMKVVGNCLFLLATNFQSIWSTKTRDMSKLLSSTTGGRGG
jgi:hypothetical protein